MIVIDPITKQAIAVKSVCYPVQTLLDGKPYVSHPTVLPQQPQKELQWKNK